MRLLAVGERSHHHEYAPRKSRRLCLDCSAGKPVGRSANRHPYNCGSPEKTKPTWSAGYKNVLELPCFAESAAKGFPLTSTTAPRAAPCSPEPFSRNKTQRTCSRTTASTVPHPRRIRISRRSRTPNLLATASSSRRRTSRLRRQTSHRYKQMLFPHKTRHNPRQAAPAPGAWEQRYGSPSSFLAIVPCSSSSLSSACLN